MTDPRCVNYEEDYSPSEEYNPPIEEEAVVLGIDLTDAYRDAQEN